VREFLPSGTRTAKLATAAPDGAPHVMPVWFVLCGDDLVFTTGAETVKGATCATARALPSWSMRKRNRSLSCTSAAR
jgi:Pyridoxamine 5'-phosphate oxidase